jgi:hypothetical protein
MKNIHREQIQSKLRKFVDNIGSNEKAATAIGDVSSATISQILNDKWEKISDSMWRNIGAGIGWVEDDWLIAETTDFETLSQLLNDVKEYSEVHGVVGREGTGKSEAFKNFAENNKNIFWIRGNEFFTPKYFFQSILKMMGKEPGTMNVPELNKATVGELEKLEKPVVIFDEADKLSDKVLSFFITLYNDLEDKVGIVLGATGFLEKRVIAGVNKDKRGFREIYSRLGKKFIELDGLNSLDIKKIIMLNGIDDPKIIAEIQDDCYGDIRRIKKLMKKKYKAYRKSN